jgi:F0F1-type ATP synthase assembly protein I
MVLGGVGGIFLDHVLGSSPWVALAGSFLGLSVSFFAVQAAVQRIYKSSN